MTKLQVSIYILLLTGSNPLTYPNYIFTEFDNRRITYFGKICQVWQPPVFGSNFAHITTFARVWIISI